VLRVNQDKARSDPEVLGRVESTDMIKEELDVKNKY
jgi:hypothetical protein